MHKKPLPSPKNPTPPTEEIRREFAQGLIVGEGLQVWATSAIHRQLASRHASDPEAIRTATANVSVIPPAILELVHPLDYPRCCCSKRRNEQSRKERNHYE